MLDVNMARAMALRFGADARVEGDRLVFYRDGRPVGSTLVDDYAGYLTVAERTVCEILDIERA